MAHGTRGDHDRPHGCSIIFPTLHLLLIFANLSIFWTNDQVYRSPGVAEADLIWRQLTS